MNENITLLLASVKSESTLEGYLARRLSLENKLLFYGQVTFKGFFRTSPRQVSQKVAVIVSDRFSKLETLRHFFGSRRRQRRRRRRLFNDDVAVKLIFVKLETNQLFCLLVCFWRLCRKKEAIRNFVKSS